MIYETTYEAKTLIGDLYDGPTLEIEHYFDDDSKGFQELVNVVRNCEAVEVAIKNEIAHLKNISDNAIRTKSLVLAYVAQEMDSKCINKTDGLRHFALSTPKTPTVLTGDLDVEKVPKEFVESVDKFKKAEMVKSMKAGNEFDGYTLDLANPKLSVK